MKKNEIFLDEFLNLRSAQLGGCLTTAPSWSVWTRTVAPVPLFSKQKLLSRKKKEGGRERPTATTVTEHISYTQTRDRKTNKSNHKEGGSNSSTRLQKQ